MVLTRSNLPPIKSFQELELQSNPSKTVRFTCSARCEPLCSLNWFINSHKLNNETLTRRQIANSKLAENNNENDSVILRKISQITLADNNAIASSTKLDLILQEILSKVNNEKKVANGLTSWLYEAHISSGGELSAIKRPTIQLDTNAMSTLELTYEQIKGLLAKYNDDLQIKCAIGDAHMNSWPFKYQIVTPNEWFPSENPMTSSFFMHDSKQLPHGINQHQSIQNGPKQIMHLQTRIVLESECYSINIGSIHNLH